eukprot:TRINITY_DN48904_c0_g1_i1.p1 TRINITY_DN48904_c0_g1~~TRINITY_DN48904_c0_g1_i1.p1  ORF type:complete len:514 (+),score=254.97 TRINITY_DN48904_c0_g1_i1:37-1542(+)
MTATVRVTLLLLVTVAAATTLTTTTASSSCSDLLSAKLPWTQVPAAPNAHVPSARFGHSAVWHAASKSVLVYGGILGKLGSTVTSQLLRGTLRAATSDVEWKQLSAAPSPRVDHCAVLGDDGDSMFVFGGRTHAGQFPAQMLRYSIAHDTWSEVDAKAINTELPIGRRCANNWVRTISGDRAIMFGGNNGTMDSGDVWSFEFKTLTWSKMSDFLPDFTTTQGSHSSAVIAEPHADAAHQPKDPDFLLFGDIQRQQVNTGVFLWRSKEINFSPFRDDALSGAPSTRTGLTMVSAAQHNAIYVFGGRDNANGDAAVDKFFQDAYRVDVDTKSIGNSRWHSASYSGETKVLPDARSLHSAVLADETCMLVFGGLTINNDRLDDLWAFDVTYPGVFPAFPDDRHNHDHPDKGHFVGYTILVVVFLIIATAVGVSIRKRRREKYLARKQRVIATSTYRRMDDDEADNQADNDKMLIAGENLTDGLGDRYYDPPPLQNERADDNDVL